MKLYIWGEGYNVAIDVSIFIFQIIFMVCFFLPKLLLCLVERLDELEL